MAKNCANTWLELLKPLKSQGLAHYQTATLGCLCISGELQTAADAGKKRFLVPRRTTLCKPDSLNRAQAQPDDIHWFSEMRNADFCEEPSR
jgi:hypothetical protein